MGVKTAVVSIALLVLFWTPARAQFEPLAFAVCKKLPDDMQRLKCFDAIGPKPKTPEEEAKNPTPVKGRWVFQESKSPIDDSDQVVAMLGGEPDNTLLAFRCQEKRTEAIFVPPPGFFTTGNTRVLIRIGDAAAETISMAPGTNNTTLFVSPAIPFMRLLPNNTKLFLRAFGYQGKQADGSFDLGDVGAVRDRIAETCHWTTPKTNSDKPEAKGSPATAAAMPKIKQKPTAAHPHIQAPLKLN
jgi:hypothetical protein